MTNPTRKKVLYLITKSNWGGAQRYVYDLATNLDQTLYEPVVALGGNGTLKDMLTHAHIRVITIQSLERDISLKNEIAFAKELKQILRSERPAVLHVNSSKAGGVGTLLGRLARVPRIIFTAHGWAFNEDRPWWQRVLIKTLHWLTVLLSHKTIAVSNAIITQLNWPGAKHKMILIHPGRNIGVMYSKTDARNKLIEQYPALRTSESCPWIISIAELHPIKRINVLIDAISIIAKKHTNIRCLIIGDGSEKAILEKQITNLKLQDHIVLLGTITEAARFLPAGDLFVLPSKSESYGYVVHEAGLARVPVITTNVGGIPDIVTDKETGVLVPPDDTEALTEAITNWLESPKMYQEYAKRLHEKLQIRTVERMVLKTSAVYSLRLK